jgi:hypothetical protein
LLLKRNDATFYSKLFSRADVETWFDGAAELPLHAKNSKALRAPIDRPTAAASPLQELNDSVRSLNLYNRISLPNMPPQVRACRVIDGAKSVRKGAFSSGQQVTLETVK